VYFNPNPSVFWRQKGAGTRSKLTEAAYAFILIFTKFACGVKKCPYAVPARTVTKILHNPNHNHNPSRELNQ